MRLVNSALRLNPFLPKWFLLAPFLAEYMQGNYETALKISMQMFLPGYPVASLIRAAAFGMMKKAEEAEREISEILRVFPAFPAVGRRTVDKVFYHQYQSEAIAEGLNAAGLKI
ncbi:MAG: hypothetical protein IJD04_04025 [Desulfovibrionaceae bacterium]|nr:hypothetical protein [Desulfovibrionaceae bacterium]